ncbi:kinase-like domain-containing protein [Chiua virens]|nr:kinase-like domain-containing protein [Chiua virens]
MSDSLPNNFIGAVKDEWRLFSDHPEDYTIGSPIGFGASSVVYAAVYNPPLSLPELPRPYPCALKVLDLDSLPPRSLALLQRETQLMSLSKHPNVLRVRGSWVDGHKLYIALRLMNKGSAADIMNYAWPGGMEEEVVKCILKQALEGLNYLHVNGFIHRDVKAANLLVDDDGTVLDDGERSAVPTTSNLKFGVPSRPIHSDDELVHSRPPFGKRRSFVGTPCWMAPELIQGKRYDAKADIWSFGITAIELTQGRPPRSRESAHAVLLQIVQGKSPTLDRKGGFHHYSHGFKEIVDACLAKNPSERPTAAELLQTSFFKNAKKKPYLVRTILDGLPPLTMRQGRHRREDHPTVQRTADSWDFSSTVISSNASSPIVSSPGNAKSLSIPTDHSPNEKSELCKDDTPETSQQVPVEPSATIPSIRLKSMPCRPTTAIPASRDRTLESPRAASSHLVLPDLNPTPLSPSFWDKLTRKPRAATTGGLKRVTLFRVFWVDVAFLRWPSLDCKVLRASTVDVLLSCMLIMSLNFVLLLTPCFNPPLADMDRDITVSRKASNCMYP